MGESRIELLAWLNDLLQLNYTKVEQCGGGAAACGIIDSIYGDVPLTKVKFNAKHEYEYVANWKVLQTSFKQHKIDKVVPVEKLIKCKMMENLEFLQWLKRYWDLHFPGHEYDALRRRRGAVVEPNPLITGVGSSHAPPTARAPSAAAASNGSRMAPVRKAAPAAVGARATGANDLAVQRLTTELGDLKLNLDGLGKERDFYFAKVRHLAQLVTRKEFDVGQLRDIEILVGARLEAEPAIPEEEAVVLREIQAVLYQTEEGFEIPDVEAEEQLADEEETF